MLALVTLICLGWTGVACSAPKPKPEATLNGFLAAFSSGDTATAAGDTDNAGAAKPLLDSVRTALKPTAISTTVDGVRTSGGDGNTASATYTMKWDLGQSRTWSYQATADMKLTNNKWQVTWAPSVIHPKLAAQQTLAVREVVPDPAPLLDRDGAVLLGPQKVVSVMLDPKTAGDLASVANSLASALSPFDNTITQQSIVDGAGKVAAGQAYPVATLRDADYQQVKPKIHDLPGVSFVGGTKPLAPSKTFANQVLSGIRNAVGNQLAGTAGWRVVTVDATGNDVAVLQEQAPQPGQAVTSTLSTKIQTAAESALAAVPQQGAIVAIQPSTGDVLAVAQNAAADAAGPIALTGKYPPGSTFKTVTAVAGLESGTVNGDSPVGCPGTVKVNGQEIPNANKFDKGTIPLHSAYAFSCNTTFGPLAASLPADALTNAAKQLGVGVDFTMPGATTITGSVPPTPDAFVRATDGFGQGKVTASPFGMALAAAAVAKGSMPMPTLIRGTHTTADTTPQPIPQPVLDAMRPMMREVVTSGTATQLRDLPDVAGKTGTAEYDVNGTLHSHGWFNGYSASHDLAFAVLLVDAGSSTPAVNVAGTFLRSLG
jgi:cell division protein FtsI/penicillin-binding protein 2